MVMVGRCCVCKKLRDDEGDFVGPEALDLPPDQEFSDTFCIPCFRLTYPDHAHLVSDPIEA